MKRRNFLLAVGAVATLPLIPRIAQEVWDRVAAAYPPADGLGEAHIALVSTLADTIIPRTDTLGATDVGVPAWVNLIFAEHFSSAERTVFLGGLDAIDDLAKAAEGAPFAMIPTERRGRVIAVLDHPNAYERFVVRLAHSRRFAQAMTRLVDRSVLDQAMTPLAQRARTYMQLKELVVHGYFTSEHVHKEVLKAQIMPGRFDGAAPMRVAMLGRDA